MEIQISDTGLKSIMEGISDAFASFDAEWNYTYVNSKAAHVMGKEPEELIGENIWKLFPQMIDSEGYVKMHEVAKTLVPIVYETKSEVTGSWYEVRIYPSVEGITVFFTDINQRKVAEEGFRFRQAWLEAQTNSIPDGVLIVNAKGKILSYNANFREIWNIPQSILDDKDDDAALQFAMKQLVDPQGFIDRVNYLYETKTPSGSEDVLFKDGRTIKRYGNAITAEDGTYYGWAWYFRDVTEQRNSKKKIQEAEERTRIAIEAAELGTFDLNLLTGSCIYSPDFHKIFGLDQPVHGTKYADMIQSDDAEIRIEAKKKSLKKGRLNYEVRIVWEDGSIHWIRVDAKQFFDNHGTPLRLLGAVKDISEQKQLELSLQRYKYMVENANDAFILLDENGNFIFINQAGIKSWGYTQKEIETLKFSDIDSAYEGNSFSQLFALAQKQYIPEFESFHKRKDGHLFPVELSVGGLVLNKQPYLFATARNITKRKETERALKLSLDKFRLLSDSMPQFVWTGDAEGNLNYFNQSVYDYSGLSKEEVDLNGWLQIVHPDEQEENIKAWIHAVKTGEDFLFNHRFRRHDGEYRWQLSRAIAQKNSEGHIQMWVGTSTDIHDQKKFAEQLEKSVEERTNELKLAINQLVTSNRELEQFAYVSSHDLQEPLRKIQTFAEMLSESLKDIKESELNYLNKIKTSASRMSDLIKDLLEFSRLSNKETIVETDLNQIILKVISDFEIVIEQKKAHVYHPVLPVIKAIPIQMNQLFYNLISNALKFSEKDPVINIDFAIVGHLEIKDIPQLDILKPHLKITIKDNGIGFSSQYAEKIFVIFQRLNDRQKYSGTGIGLAICKKIVENHHGFISVESTPGDGSLFTIFLPIEA
jgi:PAS domain S-box-containing protein